VHHRAIDAARLPAQIADFGLSRSIAHSRSRRTTSSGGAGTDCWMPPEGLAGKCGDTASLTFSYDVHPTGSLLYCADRPGLVDGLGVSYCESMAVSYGRCGSLATLLGGFRPRAVLLSGGVHACSGESDHERNDNILKGRWRLTRANGSHIPAGRSTAHTESLKRPRLSLSRCASGISRRGLQESDPCAHGIV
jgi:hypothetical protein